MGRNNNYDDRRAQRDAENKQALMIVQPPRLPYPEEAAIAGFTAGQWKSLVDAVFPNAKSVDGVLLAMNYCKARGLDVFKRVVHVVPMYSAALGREVETVWPGISELRTTASRTGEWAGNDDCVFGPEVRRKFEDSREKEYNGRKTVQREACDEITFPEWAQITVYRIVKGHRVGFVGPKIRFVEAFSGTKGLRVPNAKWQLSPYQMMEKNAEVAALRRAFPEEIGNELTADEMEGKVFEQGERLVEHRAVMDGGDATPTDEKKPVREDFDRDADAGDESETSGEEAKWDAGVESTLEWMRNACAATKSVEALKVERDKQIFASEDEGWPADAVSEVARIFDDRIAEIEQMAAGPKPAADAELPLEGENAGTPDTTDQPAGEDENEQKAD